MKSVRITAAGAVLVACLSFLTAPARACDERFIKSCEKAAAATFAAEQGASEPSARRSSKRVKVVASRKAKHSRLVKRSSGPRFALRSARRSVLAAGDEGQAHETPMARRFRGFIAPQPLAQNAFEALRKPRAVALDFDAAPIVPTAETVTAAAPAPVEAAAVPATPPTATVTTPKQNRLASRQVALFDVASAESRPVTLPDLPPVKPVVRVAQADVAAPPAAPTPVVQAVVSESPLPAPQPSGGFSIHGLVLALCGALGAASALRFVVGA